MFETVIMLTIIVICVIIAICVFAIALFRSYERKCERFVIDNSFALRQLKEINSRYVFYHDLNPCISHTYDNEKMYDTISCSDYLIYQMQFEKFKWFDQIKKANANKIKYTQYIKEVTEITDFRRFQNPIGKLKSDKLIEIERNLFHKNTYGKPVTQFCVKVLLCCSTINGRIYRKKTNEFTPEDIFSFDKRLSNRNGKFYNDKGIWDALCRVERGKVSNKLRFYIYKRDGYRCKKCGVHDRYAVLEVDHIIPIAKGGKSTVDNLQTLCHKCNVEKGAD